MGSDFEAKIEELKRHGYYIGYLDGATCLYEKSFVIEIGKAFRFPDYYGANLDALDECINDLDWIDEKNYVLVILNSNLFLKNATEERRQFIWEFFEDVMKEWASVPNYEGEDAYRSKADFVIIKA